MSTIFRIAGAYIALILGAGFATGQEVMQFFAAHGWLGLGGITIFLLGGSYLSVLLLLTGQRQKFAVNQAVFSYFAGPLIGKFFTAYTTLFIFLVYVVMLAGSGAVLADALEISATVGAGVMALLVMFATIFGLQKLVAIVGLMGPLLVVLVVYTSLLSITSHPGSIDRGLVQIMDLELVKATDYWWLSGSLYLTLQIFGLAGFLPMIGAGQSNRRHLVIAGVLGSTVLAAALSLVFLALIGGLPATAERSIPMLQVMDKAAPELLPFYRTVILACIFTTAAPCLWIVIARFHNDDRSRRYRAHVVLVSAAGLFAAVALPFSQLVNLIYPTLGFTGAIFVLFMLIRQWRDWRAARV